MRILFLSRWYPYPADNGSRIRISGMLRGLGARHDVTLLSFIDPREQATLQPPESPGPVAIHVWPYREFEPESWAARFAYLSPRPRYLVDTHSPGMERLIRETLRENRFDLVIASQTPMAAYWRAFRGIPAIFEEAEVGIYRPSSTDEAGMKQTPATRIRRELTWIKHARFLSRALDHFSACTVASEVERRLLASAAPGYHAVHVVPNSVDVPPVIEAAHRTAGSLIFTGSLSYAPNRDAMTWFLEEIFPLIRAEAPYVRVTVTGEAGPSPPRPDPHVRLTGRVPDVRALVAEAAVSLAPIRTGGGTRLKILEAMALGTPVVATTKAAAGLDVRDGEHLLIADTPRDFARAVLHLLRDPLTARQIAGRARRLCGERYDSKVVIPRWLELVERAAAA